MSRDPRTDPRAGDVVNDGTAVVEVLALLGAGEIHYRVTVGAHDCDVKSPIDSWRSWARTAEVVSVAATEGQAK